MMWSVIRKFGLEYCDLTTMMWNVAVMLRVVSLRIDRRNTKPIPIVIFISTFACAACYFYMYQISMVWFVLVRCRETGDVLAAMMVLSLGLTSLIGITKLCFMYYYQDKVQLIVEGYTDYDALPKDVRKSESLAKTLRNVKKRAIIFWGVLMGNGVVYIMQPLVRSGRHLMYDGQILYGLEPMTETPNYQIALISIITSVLFICYIASNITGLLIVATGYTEAQMLALGQELLQLWTDAQTHYESHHGATSKLRNFLTDKTARERINKYVKERLDDIVKSHSTNIKLLKLVQVVFEPAIAVEFILLMIALIADLLGGLENTYIIMPLALMQVYMDCFTGQRLIDASLMFEKAVYDCQWENFDAANMKTVLLMLQMSQKTLKLSAGGVATLSFDCLMSLVRSIYSAYAALRTTVQA